MIACYDLQNCPPTYDVVAFLAHLEIERQKCGAKEVDIHILPGPVNGFRGDSLWPHGIEARVALRDRVLVPICRLLPSARSVTVRNDRRVEGWAKGQRKISLIAIRDALRAGSRPLRARDKAPLIGGRYITFTLRESEHHPARNSRTSEWVGAARELEQRTGIKVIVVRDTVRAEETLPGVTTDPVASVHLEYRASLYAHATLNVGICNGPMWLAIFMNAPMLMLRPTTEIGGCYDDHFYKRCGIPPGSQLPTSPPHQRLAWVGDTCDNIIAAVEEMLVA